MTEQQLQARTGPGRVVLGLVLLALAGLAVWTAITAVLHLWQPVYRQTPMRLLVTLGACAAITAGASLLWRRPGPGLALGGLMVPLLWVMTLLGAMSIGVFVFPVAVVLTIVLVTASVRAGGGGGAAAAIGIVVALSLGVLLIAQPWTPAVQCGETFVTTSGRPFDGDSGSSSGSAVGTAMPEGGHGSGLHESMGNLTLGDESYVYRCEGAELVEFRRVD